MKLYTITSLLIFLFCNTPDTESNQDRPSGRFILKGSECAGFTFVDTKTVLWTNEMFCNDPDTLRIQWINTTTFTTKNIKPHNPDCPPGVSLYEIVSYKGKKLILKEIWMGWGDHSPEITEFTKAND